MPDPSVPLCVQSESGSLNCTVELVRVCFWWRDPKENFVLNVREADLERTSRYAKIEDL